ncbi:glycine receptor subunit alphaZ1-like [Tachypleus tridentatus]|uniref:glycine receptor subunit alphaZ1-like n=1 Tax=Tachypleus tridentatus TaxID=6853 RepID=UPI003FD487B8
MNAFFRCWVQVLVSCLIWIGSIKTNCFVYGNEDPSTEVGVPTAYQASNNLPPTVAGKPVCIKTKLYVEDVNSINALDMDFRLDFFLWHNWNVTGKLCEQYKIHLHQIGLFDNRTGDPIAVSESQFDRFWIPDTYAINAKSVDIPSFASSTKALRISIKSLKTCEMEYTVRLAAVVACQMEFKQYPMDIQRCPFTIRSYAYPSSMVHYEWVDKDKNLLKNPELKLLQHNLELQKQDKLISTLDVTYSTISVVFTFERQIAHHLIQIFAPSALIVTLSWFSFWMGLEAIPGRVSLCVTSLLSLFTQFSGIRGDLPPASYINGTDIWMATCMLFVFATLMEFVVVKFLDKRRQLYFRSQVKNSLFSIPESGQGSLVSLYSQTEEERRISPTDAAPRLAWNMASQQDTHRWFKPPSWSMDWVVVIDHASRLLFPLAFLMFNTFYWPILLNRQL